MGGGLKELQRGEEQFLWDTHDGGVIWIKAGRSYSEYNALKRPKTE